MADPLAVVTGAGQGIGRAVARKLAAHGVSVVLVGRSPQKLADLARELEADGQTASAQPTDVTRSADVQRLAAWLHSTAGRVDMLINCAGESLIGKLEETSEADWDRIFAVNLKGPFLMTRALLPLLRQSQNASIINVASKVALKGYQPVSAYTAAKTGLLGFTRALAAELRDEEIRVVALCPGPVDTPMRWAATPHFDRKVVIDPEVIAETVWHLVSLPRGVTTGEILIQSGHYD